MNNPVSSLFYCIGQSSNGHPKTPRIHLGGRTEEKCFRRRGGEEEEGWWEEEIELEQGGGVRGREASHHSYHLRASPYYEVGWRAFEDHARTDVFMIKITSFMKPL